MLKTGDVARDIGVSFQTAVSDSEGREQNSEDTADTESVSKSLSDSDTDAVISDMDSLESDNPFTAPEGSRQPLSEFKEMLSLVDKLPTVVGCI